MLHLVLHLGLPTVSLSVSLWDCPMELQSDLMWAMHLVMLSVWPSAPTSVPQSVWHSAMQTVPPTVLQWVMQMARRWD